MPSHNTNNNNNKNDITLLHAVLDEAARLLMAQLPVLQQVSTELVDLIFVPKMIARQLVVWIALETGLLTLKQVTNTCYVILSHVSSRNRLLRSLATQQSLVTTQDEWMELAERMDQIQQHDKWRSDPNCPLYERERISARIDEYVHLIRRRDIFELMFVLRGSIGRNKFGLLHEGLFTKALAGTKVLVETYHNVVCAALDFVCDAPVLPGEPPIPTQARLAFFNETRHAYGRTALLLSGGASLGFYHVGVVRTLMENRLMPRVLGGSSAGSIVCAMIGTRTDEECMQDMFQVKGTDAPGHSGQLVYSLFRPHHYQDEDAAMHPTQQQVSHSHKEQTASPPHSGGGGGGVWGSMSRVYSNTAGAYHDVKLTLQGLIPIPFRRVSSFLYDIVTGSRRAQDIFKNDTAYFRNCVRLNVGNFTFQEAFDRTGRILNIVVTPTNSSDPPRLLNYLTAPHVLVWSAAVASSSLPGVFEANRLVVKEADGWERYESGGGQAFSDGSMEQDLPMQQLSEMFNVNHFIISQANPHAVMFASYHNRSSVWSNPVLGFLSSIVDFLRNQIRSWLDHLVECVGARRIAPQHATARGLGATFFTQEYEGRSIDISLIPWIGHRGLLSALLHIIYNPSEAEFREWIQAASRETWKYLPAIKSHIAEEVTIDRCVQRLRRRMLHESFQKRNAASTVEHGKKMEDRVPSFYTSSDACTALVNMGGQAITDQTSLLHPSTIAPEERRPAEFHPPAQPLVEQREPVVAGQVNHNMGWGGLGLRGNRSSGNLQRSHSDASGLFIDEEENNSAAPDSTGSPVTEQDAGEDTTGGSNRISKKPTGSISVSTPPLQSGSEGANLDQKGYIKTSSMAKFYYRKNPSYGDVARLQSVQSFSTDAGNNAGSNVPSSKPQHTRRRSKSHADLDAGR